MTYDVLSRISFHGRSSNTVIAKFPTVSHCVTSSVLSCACCEVEWCNATASVGLGGVVGMFVLAEGRDKAARSTSSAGQVGVSGTALIRREGHVKAAIASQVSGGKLVLNQNIF